MNAAVVAIAVSVGEMFLDVVHDGRHVVGGTRQRNGTLLHVVIAFDESQSVDGRCYLLLLLHLVAVVRCHVTTHAGKRFQTLCRVLSSRTNLCRQNTYNWTPMKCFLTAGL